MKKIKFVSVLLVVALLLSVFSASVYAAGADKVERLSTAESKSKSQTVLTETNVRQAVSSYFAQRRAFLRGEAEEISIAVPAITTDEAKHLAAMQAADISYVNSLLTEVEISCREYYAMATSTELATYSDGDQSYRETVVHEIRVYMHDDGRVAIASDAYRVEIVAFDSCSYVEESLVNTNAATAGSNLCIINVAQGECGYTERGYNQTKYNDWFGMPGEPWCAMFVVWCANQANISTTIIPIKASCPGLREFYLGKRTYYESIHEGGNYTPKAGDLFFQFDSADSPDHVGLVVSVNGNTMTVIDGNSGDNTDEVIIQTIKLTDTSLVAFASPAYVTSGHSAGSTWSSNASAHWKTCVNCSATCSYAAHTFILVQTGGPYRCKTCNYTTYAVVNALKPEEERCS